MCHILKLAIILQNQRTLKTSARLYTFVLSVVKRPCTTRKPFYLPINPLKLVLTFFPSVRSTVKIDAVYFIKKHKKEGETLRGQPPNLVSYK